MSIGRTTRTTLIGLIALGLVLIAYNVWALVSIKCALRTGYPFWHEFVAMKYPVYHPVRVYSCPIRLFQETRSYQNPTLAVAVIGEVICRLITAGILLGAGSVIVWIHSARRTEGIPSPVNDSFVRLNRLSLLCYLGSLVFIVTALIFAPSDTVQFACWRLAFSICAAMALSVGAFLSPWLLPASWVVTLICSRQYVGLLHEPGSFLILSLVTYAGGLALSVPAFRCALRTGSSAVGSTSSRWLAVVSLVSSGASLLFLHALPVLFLPFGVAGIGLGHVAWHKNKGGADLRAGALAVAGLFLGYLVVVFPVAWRVLLRAIMSWSR